MTRVSKEHILAEIRRLAIANDGAAPGLARFVELTGIGTSQWKGVYWARWSDAISEAGLEPNTWSTSKLSDEELLQFLADATRKVGHVPTGPEMQLWKRTDPDVPHPQVLRTRFGPKPEQIAALLAFAQTRPDYTDVAAVVTASSSVTAPRPAPVASNVVVTGAVYLLRMGEYFKVGKTNDPGRRTYELGLRLPEKHELIHVIDTDDPSGIEAYWHKRFARKQTNGEWYALSPDDVAAFARRTYM